LPDAVERARCAEAERVPVALRPRDADDLFAAVDEFELRLDVLLAPVREERDDELPPRVAVFVWAISPSLVVESVRDAATRTTPR